MSRTLIKKRGPVEVYFILYLAALILILPDLHNDKKGNKDAFDETSAGFIINPVKPSLSCRLYIDSSGVRISEFDAENTIHYSGAVKNVKMLFTITDEETNNSIMLETDKDYESSDFNITHNLDNNLVKFYWKPPIYERRNKNYIVNVTARANPTNLSDSLLEKTGSSTLPTIVKKAQFRLAVYVNRPGNVIYLPSDNVDLVADSAKANSTKADLRTNSEFYTGDMSLYTVHSPLRSIANQQWENRIIVIGLNPQKDLAELPELAVSGAGNAYISGITANEIKLSGTTPSSGRTNVKLKLTRKYDKREVMTDFSIIPEPLFKPDYDAEMYPDNTYTIDPKLPSLPGQDVKVVLTVDNNIILTSRQGSTFEYTPNADLIDKTVSIERYVNGKKIGQTYPIKIMPLPPPSIANFNEKSARLITFEIVSQGLYRGEKNLVTDIEIIGNAKWQEYFPNIQSDNLKRNSNKQFFMLTPLKDDQPFRFRARAVDKRGKKSEYFIYD